MCRESFRWLSIVMAIPCSLASFPRDRLVTRGRSPASPTRVSRVRGQRSRIPSERDESSWRAVLQKGVASPGPEDRSYTRVLLADRNLRLKKIGEEAAEFVTACADADPGRAVEEAADIVYHIAVALEALDTSIDAVALTLFDRSADAKDAGRLS